MANNVDVKDFTSGLARPMKTRETSSVNTPLHQIEDSAGGELLGTKTDAKSTATDTTSISFMSVFKQISSSIQAAATSLASLVTALGSTAYDLGVGTGGARTQRVAMDTTQVPAVGQALMNASIPVALASNQSTLPVSVASIPSHAVTNAGTFATQAASAGDVAAASADSGNPVKVGARARSSEITALANNNRSDLLTDLAGKLLVLPYANPENFVSGAITTAMTGTTSTSLVAAAGAGLRNYITTLIVSNAHATVGTDIIIQDGSGGTTLMTIPAAAVYGGAVINLPVPLRQPTANTAIFCANVTTGASTKVSAVGYKGV